MSIERYKAEIDVRRVVVGWAQEEFGSTHWHLQRLCGQTLCGARVDKGTYWFDDGYSFAFCRTCQQLLNEGLLSGYLSIRR